MLIHALDGFLTAGAAPRLAATQLRTGKGEVVHRFDLDELYRLPRPPPVHHASGPTTTRTTRTRRSTSCSSTTRPALRTSPARRPGARLPLGVVHRRRRRGRRRVRRSAHPRSRCRADGRPAHASGHDHRARLASRARSTARTCGRPSVRVPSSVQALLEYRFAQRGLDAAGYVVHVPHYLAQVDYPTAAVALLDAVVDRARPAARLRRPARRPGRGARRDRAADRRPGRRGRPVRPRGAVRRLHPRRRPVAARRGRARSPAARSWPTSSRSSSPASARTTSADRSREPR